MRLAVKDIKYISCLDEDESDLLEKVLMLFEFDARKTWRKYHVEKHDMKSPQTEYCVVCKVFFLIYMDPLVQSVPTLSKVRLKYSVLVFKHEVHYPKRRYFHNMVVGASQ